MNSFARRLLPALATLIACASMLLLLAPAASAETAYDASSFTCGGSWGGGQADMAGTVYIACGTTMVRYAYNGTKLANVTLPGSAYDLAPSPDGAIVYFTYNSTLARMVRRADGSYAYDKAWVPASFMLAGQPWAPRGRFLATDGHGDIYWSNGGWQNGQPNVVVKYAPNGTVKTMFGDFGAEVGQFNVNMGITVSRDGRTIYTVEQVNGRVQRFDYAADGSYRFTMTWGKSDSEYCRAGNFAAPYDVGVDPWGYVYVMDTSCLRVEKFTGNGARLGTVATVTKRCHGLAVDARGNFYVGQTNLRFRRAATNPEPGALPAITPLPLPDTEAPALNGITVPDPTTKQTVNIGIAAADNVAVTEVRVANEDGAWGAWKPFANPLSHTLTAGYGVKSVTVQVRDAAGHESGLRTATLTFRDADATAPALVGVTVPAVTTVRTIDVAIDATDNVGVTEVRIANEDGNWTAWQPYAATVQHELTAGYGYKGVTVQVRDRAGNESATLLSTLQYADAAAEEPAPAPGDAVDIAAPSLVNVTVPPTTSTQQIAVAIEATDDVAVTQVRLANEDGTWGAWGAWATTVQHTLTAGYGTKGVFVQVRDAAGNESNTVYRTLRFEEQAVAGPVDVADPMLVGATMPALTPTREVTITLEATDDVAVTRMRFANEDGTWAAWQQFAAQAIWQLTDGFGPKAVFVQVGDAAGRTSTTLLLRTSYEADAPLADGAAPDAEAPVLAGIAMADATTTQEVTIGLDATDNAGVAQVRIANEDGNWTAWQAFAPQVQWMLSAGYGQKLVFVQVRDAAGNESNVLTRRTSFQEQAPVAGAPADAADPLLTAIVIPEVSVTRVITVNLDATDDVGVTQVRLANEDGEWGAWTAWAPQVQWTLSEGNTNKVVFAQVRDAAGRESNVMFARTLLQM